MGSVLHLHPALFAFVGALVVVFVLMAFLLKARFALFLSAIALTTGLILTSYFLGARPEELLMMALGGFLLSIGSYLLSKVRRKAE